MTTDSLESSNGLLLNIQKRLSEACDELWGSFVDPHEAISDEGYVAWTRLGGASHRQVLGGSVRLDEIRRECRVLAISNEFAINGHENRISYTIGTGHSYRATAKKGRVVPDGLPIIVQDVLDDFIYRNDWHARQQEIVLRKDRDGEVFLRYFVDEQGLTSVRFVEPEQISTPNHVSSDPHSTMGIRTDPSDVEKVLGYYIDDEFIHADEIQHRKANVDFNVKRGLPLYYPVRGNLRRAEKLLRNMSVVAEIQTAIALIRRHHRSNRTAVQQFVQDRSDHTTTNPATGKSIYTTKFPPGTILDADASVEYDFPASGLDASNYVGVLQAELRAIAARLVMPEFMLSSDASNANYSSTMIAEGPAVRMFQRMQGEQMAADRKVMWRVLDDAVAFGHLSSEVRGQIEIQIQAPSLQLRDVLREAQVNRIEHESGILSPQTWSQRRGLDYDQERENIERDRTKMPSRRTQNKK